MQYTYVHVQDDCVIVAQDDITHKIHFCSRMLFYVSALQGMTQKKTFFHSDQANQSSSRQREREDEEDFFPFLASICIFSNSFSVLGAAFQKSQNKNKGNFFILSRARVLGRNSLMIVDHNLRKKMSPDLSTLYAVSNKSPHSASHLLLSPLRTTYYILSLSVCNIRM